MKLWKLKKFKRARENNIEFAYDYENLNASYVNEKIIFSDDYFQEIINLDFGKIDSLFQQTSSLKPYVPTVILEKIIFDLEDEVVSLLEKDKENLKTIESLKSNDVETSVKSSEKVVSETENKSENDCQVFKKVCDSAENPNVIAHVMFKLSVSQSVLPISVTKTSYASNGVENLDTLSSVKRPKPSGVMWMRKGSSNTLKADLYYVNHSNLNKNVKRYSRKNLMACNNSDIRSAFDYNKARNALCNARMNASVDVNNLFVFYDIIDSGCSKHMTGNRALLTNFVEKFLGTVRFRNNDFAVIAGYEDVVIGSMTIKKVYYVKGLGHNLFSVGQFCDKGLEVAFRKSTCFVRNEDGVDLLTGDRSSNLYTIAPNKVALNSSTCILAKASSSQYWLWHQRISHLNFATINNLVKNNIVQGLPKMKFKKDHLCSACEQEKIHRKHHKFKTDFASNQPLYLLRMDLCGPMRVESINRKRYVLVVVDDYSRYTWVFFLHSKDEASEAKAIATACFTQNHSIIHKRFDKTPYEIMNKRKPNIKFFSLFECRCYLLNDYEDVGKLKAKEDIRVFVGYSKESAAFRIYNK
uniref:Ribonuclease H-like domain-containing protein n=1 Tax=Tanacetum cinerariifolium TaxID=118510 RepID=A0A699K1N7_TANCI|nr:ribonuclease H-like domain-containing protein [Tanacetum cinerariifolium]